MPLKLTKEFLLKLIKLKKKKKKERSVYFLRLTAKIPKAIRITMMTATKPMIIHVSLLIPPKVPPLMLGEGVGSALPAGVKTA